MSRILIIEDEPAIRRVLVKILSEEDKSHEIDEAENGIEAINHIKKNSYDLIISDFFFRLCLICEKFFAISW